MTLADEINTMIVFALSNIEISSAAGDSPKINRVTNIPNLKQADLESMIEGSGSETSNSEGQSGVSGKGGKLGAGDIGVGLGALGGKGGVGLLSRGVGAIAPAVPLAIALSIQPISEAIIKELQRPGGFLDKRVKIDARKEAFAELDRQTRQNTRIGDRRVIIQTVAGFRSNEGAFSTNTLDLIRENANRVTEIGLFDRASGVQP